MQNIVYRFLDCLNDKDSGLYNLEQYNYLITIIEKLQNYNSVLQNVIFVSIRTYFFKNEHNSLNLEKFSRWLDNNINNFNVTQWDWMHFAIITNEETKKELDIKNTFKNILPFYDIEQNVFSLKTLAFNQISSSCMIKKLFNDFKIDSFLKFM